MVSTWHLCYYVVDVLMTAEVCGKCKVCWMKFRQLIRCYVDVPSVNCVRSMEYVACGIGCPKKCRWDVCRV